MSSLRTTSANGRSISVDDGLCKGCGICAHVCPTDVFEMSGTGRELRPIVVDPGACVDCGTCSLICPDFALEVAADD